MNAYAGRRYMHIVCKTQLFCKLLVSWAEAQSSTSAVTWNFRCGFGNAIACGQLLHSHCSFKFAEKMLRGDFRRLENPSPLLSLVTKEVLLMPVLDALLADPSTSQSTLFLFRSMQRGKRIKEKRLYQRRQLRNGSDLTIWWEEHRLLHVGIFAVTWGTTR